MNHVNRFLLFKLVLVLFSFLLDESFCWCQEKLPELDACLSRIRTFSCRVVGDLPSPNSNLKCDFKYFRDGNNIRCITTKPEVSDNLKLGDVWQRFTNGALSIESSKEAWSFSDAWNLALIQDYHNKIQLPLNEWLETRKHSTFKKTADTIIIETQTDRNKKVTITLSKVHNFMPIEKVIHMDSNNMTVVKVLEFSEINPGIYFPKRVSTKSFAYPNETVLLFQDVRVNIPIDQKMFKLELKPGTRVVDAINQTVEVIKEDGTRGSTQFKYVDGEKLQSPSKITTAGFTGQTKEGGFTMMTLLYVGIAVLALVVIVLTIYRRQYR